MTTGNLDANTDLSYMDELVDPAQLKSTVQSKSTAQKMDVTFLREEKDGVTKIQYKTQSEAIVTEARRDSFA